jgi:ribosomal protein S12 methylthiotransferase
VIVDEIDGETGEALGRTRFDAPEIDQIVKLRSERVQPGDIIRAIITGSDGYDLSGERAKV